MVRVLVLYATKTGSTQGIAEQIGATLQSLGADVDVISAEEKPDCSVYSAAVVGSGVRAGLWHASAKQWLVGHADELKSIPLALFTVCLTMATNPERTDTVRGYTDLLLSETSLEPVDVGLFAGKNEPKALPVAERLIMKAMQAPIGDFRDMDAVAAWAEAIAPKLGISAEA